MKRLKRVRSSFGILGGLMALMCVARASAATVSLATYNELAYATGAFVGVPPGGQVQQSGPTSAILQTFQCDPLSPGVCGTARALTSAAALSAEVSGATGGEFNAGSTASIVYYYEVASPNNIQTTVPMLFSGFLEATAGGSFGQSQAYFSNSAGGPNFGFTSVCAGAGSADTGSCATVAGVNSLTITNSPFSVTSGGQYYLQMVATGDVNVINGVPGAYTALADPTISIDPTWLATHPGYSLELSSNVSPVPLPPASSLLLSGIGLLGIWRALSATRSTARWFAMLR